MTKPRIALTLAAPNGLNEVSHSRYREALEAAGAEVVTLYPSDPVPTNIDGLLLSGGGDIAPDRYGQPDEACEGVNPARDELEITAAQLALDSDLPILGICRGFQVLNVVRGGQLLQHVDDHNPADRNGVVEHKVQPAAGSHLAAATNNAPLTVNSRHHQAVTRDNLGQNLEVTAEVDGLVEAFEATDHRWVVGVQWHPERKWEVSPGAVGIFDAFVAAAQSATKIEP